MKHVVQLKKDIQEIQERNKRVEKDKAWETSWTRRIAIASTTYLLMSLLMYTLGVEKPLLSAIIPALAYLVSTVSLGLLKSWWITKH